MTAGNFIEDLIRNFCVMVTLMYLTWAVARSFFRTDPSRRYIVIIAMAIASGWVTILLGFTSGDLVFDLRFLPGIIVAMYARRPWVIAFVFTTIALARFYYGFDRPALNGFSIMTLIGIILAAVSPYVRRARWSDNTKIVFYATAAVTINSLSMLILQKQFFSVYIKEILPLQYISTIVLCIIAAVVFRDIENDHTKRASLADDAFKDPLTELHNRRHFQKHLELVKQQSKPVSIAYLDIDCFKGINDRFGHPAGDRVLQEVGMTVIQNIRRSDYCARLGGDEFVIVLIDCHPAHALQIADSVRRAIEEYDFSAVDVDLHVTVSIGVATADQIEDFLLQNADAALYRAKAAGRNRVIHTAIT